jgi:hypothetical protein
MAGLKRIPDLSQNPPSQRNRLPEADSVVATDEP